MVYVISDIHGQADAFFDIIEQINFSDCDELYILGDIIDRGPKNFDIYKYIMDKPNIHFILGNHEDMMMSFVNAVHRDAKYDSKKEYSFFTRRYLIHWYSNGGETTHDEMTGLNDEELGKIFDYIEDAPTFKKLEYKNKKYLLCHGAPPFFKEWDFEENMKNFTTEDFIWERTYGDQKIPDGYTLIHGHTPVQHQFGKNGIVRYSNNTIYNIDCGCAMKKCLGCLRLDDDKEFYSYKMI